MDILPEMLGAFSLFYQAVKQTSVELVMECHDPDYETTLRNVRECISKAEGAAFQLKLFEYEGVRPNAGAGAV